MEKSCPHSYSITVFFDFSVINRQQEYFMLRNMMMLLFAILLGYATVGFAGDYVLDASTMGVGATAGENLVVKEGCLDPSKTSCTEKYKWFTATSAIKIGNLQVLGELKGDIEVIITIDAGDDPKAIKLLTPDNKGLTMTFKGENTDFNYSFLPNGVGEGGYKAAVGDGWSDTLPGWQTSNTFNEVKITVQGGSAIVYTNGLPLGDSYSFGGRITLNSEQVFNRISFEGITANDRIADIKVRGIQGSTTCNSTPTTPSTPTSSGDCTADYNSNGSLHVPCVRVPGAFGKTELYDVWMQQKFPSYSFELDLNRVTAK